MKLECLWLYFALTVSSTLRYDFTTLNFHDCTTSTFGLLMWTLWECAVCDLFSMHYFKQTAGLYPGKAMLAHIRVVFR